MSLLVIFLDGLAKSLAYSSGEEGRPLLFHGDNYLPSLRLEEGQGGVTHRVLIPAPFPLAWRRHVEII